eukprot:11231545-Alexandrium_andersonii.AAC.1
MSPRGVRGAKTMLRESVIVATFGCNKGPPGPVFMPSNEELYMSHAPMTSDLTQNSFPTFA